jgi:hypothetical protein
MDHEQVQFSSTSRGAVRHLAPKLLVFLIVFDGLFHFTDWSTSGIPDTHAAHFAIIM